MDERQIYQELGGIFRDVLDDDGLALRPDLSAKDVPAWDSFNHVNIIVAAEMRFGVKFRTAEIERLKSVGELVDLIQKKLAA